MNHLEIVPLRDEYVEDVLKISLLSFPTTAWSKDSLQKEIDENRFARYVVALKDDIVIGYGGMWLIIDEAHITNIAVHPEFRGIGAGHVIVDALVEICKIENVDSMTLEVRKSNLIAQALYKKHGFVEEGIRKAYYEDTKEDAIIMWKKFFLC